MEALRYFVDTHLRYIKHREVCKISGDVALEDTTCSFNFREILVEMYFERTLYMTS